MKQLTCKRGKRCIAGNPDQPEDEFIRNDGGLSKTCQSCREKFFNKTHSFGYDKTPHPKRIIVLAPHQEFASRDPAFASTFDPVYGLKLMRGKDGQPIVRKHSDLKPGEVSWVLG
jgi:hypothetical protein